MKTLELEEDRLDTEAFDRRAGAGAEEATEALRGREGGPIGDGLDR